MCCCTLDFIQKIICKLIIACSYILCEILKICYKNEESKVNLINIVEIFFVGNASLIDTILAFCEYYKFKYKMDMGNEATVQLTKEEISKEAKQIDAFFRRQVIIFNHLAEEEKNVGEISQLRGLLKNIKTHVKEIEKILNN